MTITDVVTESTQRTERTTPAPFVKWAGGKRQLLHHIRRRLPYQFGHYYEPFVGGGAVFFELALAEKLCQGATLIDTNEELILTYQMIKQNPDSLLIELLKHVDGNNQDHFNTVRAWDRDPAFQQRPAIQRAARFLYLNRTGYNGLYRVNRQGHFNVPFGRNKNPPIYSPAFMHAVHAVLHVHATNIWCDDFTRIRQYARPGDFIYFDPPYDHLQENSFTQYTQQGFQTNDQRMLADVFFELHRRTCFVLASNADTACIRTLYQNESTIIESVPAARMVNSDRTKRGPVNEILIRNYDDDGCLL